MSDRAPSADVLAALFAVTGYALHRLDDAWYLPWRGQAVAAPLDEAIAVVGVHLLPVLVVAALASRLRDRRWRGWPSTLAVVWVGLCWTNMGVAHSPFRIFGRFLAVVAVGFAGGSARVTAPVFLALLALEAPFLASDALRSTVPPTTGDGAVDAVAAQLALRDGDLATAERAALRAIDANPGFLGSSLMNWSDSGVVSARVLTRVAEQRGRPHLAFGAWSRVVPTGGGCGNAMLADTIDREHAIILSLYGITPTEDRLQAVNEAWMRILYP